MYVQCFNGDHRSFVLCILQGMKGTMDELEFVESSYQSSSTSVSVSRTRSSQHSSGSEESSASGFGDDSSSESDNDDFEDASSDQDQDVDWVEGHDGDGSECKKAKQIQTPSRIRVWIIDSSSSWGREVRRRRIRPCYSGQRFVFVLCSRWSLASDPPLALHRRARLCVRSFHFSFLPSYSLFIKYLDLLVLSKCTYLLVWTRFLRHFNVLRGWGAVRSFWPLFSAFALMYFHFYHPYASSSVYISIYYYLH